MFGPAIRKDATTSQLLKEVLILVAVAASFSIIIAFIAALSLI
jgi:hypothetical protein